MKHETIQNTNRPKAPNLVWTIALIMPPCWFRRWSIGWAQTIVFRPKPNGEVGVSVKHSPSSKTLRASGQLPCWESDVLGG